MVRTTVVRFVVVGTVSALAACGGGGSSGGSSDGETGTPSVPPDNVGIELDPGSFSERRAAVDSQEDFAEVLKVFSGAEQTYLAIDEIREEIRGWGDVVSQDGSTVTLSCDNSGTLSVTLNQEAPTDLTWQFRNCELETASLNRVVLDGTYTYVNIESESDGTQRVDGFQEIDLTGTVAGSGEAIAMQGADFWEIVVPPEGARTETYTTEALEFLRGNNYQAIQNAETTLSTLDETTTVTLNARLIGSLTDGFVDITTEEDIQRPSGGGCPTVGVVRVVGEPEASGVETRYGTSIEAAVAPDTVATATVIGTTDPNEYDASECSALIF
ncbi:MAG: hypothetical protein ACQEV6_12635 [Pseudomonadota bacterium]